MSDPLVAFAALHVEPGNETAALAVLDAFVRLAGLEVAQVRWAPYTKLGPNSRLTFKILLRGCTTAQSVERMEAICASLLGGEASGVGHVIHAPNDDGTFIYERIFDARKAPFALEDAHWFHIEINTFREAQEDAARRLAESRAALS